MRNTSKINKNKSTHKLEITNVDNRSFEYFEFDTYDDLMSCLNNNLKENEIAEYTHDNTLINTYKKDGNNKLIKLETQKERR